VHLHVRAQEGLVRITTPWEVRLAAPSEVLAHLLEIVQGPVLRGVRSHCLLGAASLDVGGRGVILAGPVGAGKTTLAVAVAGRGARLLSDEVAALDLSSGRLAGWARAVGIRPDTQAALGVAGEPVAWGDGTRVLIPAGNPDGESDARRVHPQMVVLLAAGSAPMDFAAAPVAVECPRHEALPQLLPCMRNRPAVGADAVPGRALLALDRLLPRTRFYTLVPGRLDDSAAWILDQALRRSD
jgi:hypothetical protein